MTEHGIKMKTIFSDRLYTNYVPSDAEMKEIREAILEPRKELEALDEKLEQMYIAIQDLSRTREELYNDIEAHTALLTPVRQLPHDILRAMFVQCLPVGHDAVMSVREAPLLLTHICSLWREIALTTPKLWSSVHIPIPSPHNDPVTTRNLDKPRIEGLRQWLARSGACPLSISVASPSSSMITAEIVAPILETLISVSDRWSDMKFIICTSACPVLAQLSPDSVPMLKSVVLEVRHDSWGSPQIGSAYAWGAANFKFLNAPRLQNLTLFDVDPQSLYFIQCPQITELRIDFEDWRGFNLSTADVLRTMQRCPHLTTCRVQISDFGTLGDDIRDRIELPFLTSLSVMEGMHAKGKELFKRLHVPSLRHIAYQRQMTPPSPPTPTVHLPPDDTVALLSLLASTTSDIESLLLSSGSFTFDSIMECLRLTPHLKRLSFDVKDDQTWTKSSWIYAPYYPPPDDMPQLVLGDSLLHSLTAGDICPLLTFFECGTSYFSDAAILAFIRSRTESASQDKAQLEHFSASFTREQAIDVRSEVGSNRMRDLALELYYSPPFPLARIRSYTPWDGLRNNTRRRFSPVHDYSSFPPTSSYYDSLWSRSA
ncbi:hypothetical protein BDQ12DRAFT_684950 [Crucibulum laeve]|uniref:F-box domain-containing protein n=1 Tax=Crucibulum laeve TaxID=68775 RepID=A0A5C3LYF5_9AGAR|nr:hypothetical protein BDQ12DRAFT_684950 [Crucibulum laeve]